MIFNNETSNITANYGYFIVISQKESKKEFILSFAPKHQDLKNLKINERTIITQDFHWDSSVVDEEGYHVLDISDIEVYLTRKEDNLFKLELKKENPHIMFSKHPKEDLKILEVDIEFSFDYDYKPLPDYEILKRGNKEHTQEELNNVLERL